MFYICLYKKINVDKNTESKIPNLGVAGSNPAGCIKLLVTINIITFCVCSTNSIPSNVIPAI
jgi:hypothetical protein